jgi:predicted negative regulator of RcsB-dependent stress response
MASQLDLEEQEQIDQLKHFWKRYGNAITWLLIAVLGAFAAYNGWQYWQRKQAGEAAVMYDQIDAAVQAGDLARLDRALADVKERYAAATYAHQSALLAARTYYEKGKVDQAKAALAWVVEKAGDEGLQAVARLRLAGIALEAKAYDEALIQLGAKMPAEFAALADDRRGDVYLAQGKKPQALAEYRKAYAAMDERAEYRRLVEVKLNALGVDVSPSLTAEVKK